jgi:hypothetical protein
LERCFISHSVIEKLRALHIHVDGVAVSSRLHTLAGYRLRRGGADGERTRCGRSAAGPGPRGVGQRACEIEIDRLVARRIGIGDVRSQNLLALSPQLQRFALEVERLLVSVDQERLLL